jgi:hypothetical protein
MDASKLEENRLVRVHFLVPSVAGGCIGKAKDYEAGDVDDIPLSEARFLAASCPLTGIKPRVLILSSLR